MGLFGRTVDRTAKRLAAGPTLVLPGDPAGPLADAVRAYDPALHVRTGRFDFDHGSLRLHGPVDVTPELAAAAALPPGTTAYYADVVETGTRGSRPDYVKWQDAERLVRGLAVRLGGSVHGARPLTDLKLAASVYAAQPVPAEQVISVLQRYATGDLFVEEYQDVPGSYFLLSQEDPAFLTIYWPPRLARSRLEPPPLALGGLRKQQPCRWELQSRFPVADAGRQISLMMGEAALALARQVDGTVIDPYGFPVRRPEDLLPR